MLTTRIITGALLGAAIIAAILLLPEPLAAAALGALWLAGAWEWAGFARLSAASRGAYVVLILAAMAATPAVLGPATDVLLGAALLWWAIALGALLSYPHRFAAATVLVAGVLVLWPSWALLARLHASGPLGPSLTMTAFAIVWAADVGAYTVGRLFGRVKLAPAVSPGKTWEGVTGGVLLAALAGAAAARLLGLPVGSLVSIGVATALVSVVGDLTASMFKRNAGLKDSGRLLPGHGGVLDRIDSLTAALPVFVLGMKLAELLGR